MDALYPRLLAARFAECFRFYDAMLPKTSGAHLVKFTLRRAARALSPGP